MNSQTDIPMNHQENPKDLKKQSFSAQFIVQGAVIIPLVLKYGYGMNLSLPLMAAYVALGEWISCFVLGELFATVLIKRRVFTSEEDL